MREISQEPRVKVISLIITDRNVIVKTHKDVYDNDSAEFSPLGMGQGNRILSGIPTGLSASGRPLLGHQRESTKMPVYSPHRLALPRSPPKICAEVPLLNLAPRLIRDLLSFFNFLCNFTFPQSPTDTLCSPFHILDTRPFFSGWICYLPGGSLSSF